MLTYSFSTSSFMNELWINGKRVFKKPTGASVEFTNGGAFDWGKCCKLTRVAKVA